MKVAYFSPFPPKKTGIAGYSRALVRSMRLQAAVTAFDDGNEALTNEDADAIDFAVQPEILTRLSDWDMRIFNLGNNPFHHLGVLRAFQKSRGLIVLHDTVLYYLFAGLSPAEFYIQFCRNYGPERAGEIAAIHEHSIDRNILRYPFPERYPFLRGVIEHADGVIVHSAFAAETVRRAAPNANVHVVPMLSLVAEESPQRAARARELRATVLTRENQVLLGTFGFLGATKRLPAICQALRRLAARIDFHFVIVGDGPDPLPEFQEAGLGDYVSWHRYVSDEDFDAWIDAADVVINLRFPSMGETSATLIRAMSMAKPCIVTDHASFSELPSDTAQKIPHGPEESAALEHSIVRLTENGGQQGREMGARARYHVQTTHAPDAIATRVLAIAAEEVRRAAYARIRTTNRGDPASPTIRRMLDDSRRAALPAHLGNPSPMDLDSLPSAVPLQLTPEEVIWAFRVLLGREPSAAVEIPSAIRNAGTLDELRRLILASQEYHSTQCSF